MLCVLDRRVMRRRPLLCVLVSDVSPSLRRQPGVVGDNTRQTINTSLLFGTDYTCMISQEKKKIWKNCCTAVPYGDYLFQFKMPVEIRQIYVAHNPITNCQRGRDPTYT